MRSTKPLASALESIVLGVAAASALTFACGGSTTADAAQASSDGGATSLDASGDGGLSYDGFTLVRPRETCATAPSLLAGIHPAEPVSAIELREAHVSDAYFADGGTTDGLGCPVGVLTNATLDRYGTPCGQAKDPAACAQRVACAVPPGTGWLAYTCSGPCTRTNQGTFYVQVVGDVITFPTDLKAMLGTIDTPTEAVLLASTLGFDTPTACGVPLPAAYKDVGGGYELLVLRYQACGTGVTQVRLRVNADGTSVVLEEVAVTPASNTACAAGRRPEGLALCKRGGAARGMRAYLSELAELEAASILEFATLREELRAHGAPETLVTAAERARRDEVAHARVTAQLARAYGGDVARLESPKRPARSLELIAVHNAVEGCVRETFGALVATWQARHASDPAVARAFATIAEDETRHAEFSFELDAWLETRLGVAARARVAAARADAIAQLRRDLCTAPHPEVVDAAGVPCGEAAARLLDGMLASLAAAA